MCTYQRWQIFRSKQYATLKYTYDYLLNMSENVDIFKTGVKATFVKFFLITREIFFIEILNIYQEISTSCNYFNVVVSPML